MKWKCCIKEPSETGKKVLVQHKGDIYVAMRIRNFYIPMPFADHYFCSHLCYPETWWDIPFPDHLTGHTRIGLPEIYGDKNSRILMKLSEVEVEYPELFNQFADMIISSIASIPNPTKKKKNER